MVYQDTNSQFQEFSQDDEKNKEQTNNNMQQPSSGGNSAPAPTAAPNAAPAPVSTSAPQRQGSGRFANIQKYVQANQGGGQQIGQKLESSVQKESDKIREGIQSSQQKFQQNVQKTQEDINKANQYAQQLQQQGGAQGIAASDSDFQNFRNIYTGQVQNPNENVSQFQTGVNKIQNISTLPFTEQGRNQLLAEFSAGPEKQYTGGQRRFDQLLVQSDPNVTRKLQAFGGQKAQEAATNLNTNLEQQKSAIQQTKDLAAIKKQALQQSIGDFNEKQEGAFGSLYKGLNEAKSAAQAQQDAKVKSLQDALKSGKIDAKTAEEYGISQYIDLGDDKVQDLTEYAYDKLEKAKVKDPVSNGLLDEMEQLQVAKQIYTDPTMLANIESRLNDVVSSLEWRRKYNNEAELGDVMATRSKYADYNKFGKADPTEQTINQYYDQLTDAFTKSNPTIFNKVGTQGTGELSNIEKMRQADLARISQLKENYTKDNQIDLTKFLKPEDLAAIAQNVQAKDANISLADVAKEEDKTRLDALMRLSGRNDISLGELMGEQGANFDFNPVQQNLKDIISQRAKEGDTGAVNLAPLREQLLKSSDIFKSMLGDPRSTLELLKYAMGKKGAVENLNNSIMDEGKAGFNDMQNITENPFRVNNLATMLSGASNRIQGLNNIGDKAMDAVQIKTGNNILDNMLNGPTRAIGNFTQNIGSIGKKAVDALKSVFCHAGDTPIKMKDGSIKLIKNIQLGDELELGGKVMGLGKAYGDNLFDYNGTLVSGDHAVYENDKWVRVKNSKYSKKLKDKKELVYPLATENMLIVTKDGTIWSDMQEVNDTYDKTDRQILRELNNNIRRNNKIKKYLGKNGNN